MRAISFKFSVILIIIFFTMSSFSGCKKIGIIKHPLYFVFGIGFQNDTVELKLDNKTVYYSEKITSSVLTCTAGSFVLEYPVGKYKLTVLINDNILLSDKISHKKQNQDQIIIFDFYRDDSNIEMIYQGPHDHGRICESYNTVIHEHNVNVG